MRPPRSDEPARAPGARAGLLGVRALLPGLILLAAVVVAIVGPRGLAPGLALGALFVLIIDWTIRCAFSSQDDRDREQRARRRYRRTGRWTDEPPDGADPPSSGRPTAHGRDRPRPAGARRRPTRRRP
ncbi:MAG: hypothetical protein AB7G37_11075 [Solirubrobacteraceae bacterium]